MPVSSSAHLRIFSFISGIEEPQTLFDVTLHFGTLLSILIVFSNEIIDIIKGLIKFSPQKVRVFIFIFLASIPSALIGGLFGEMMEKNLTSLLFISIFLFFNAIILYSTRFKKREGDLKMEDMGYKNAIIIGIAQSIGILRGISRSGITISASIFCNLNKKDAVSFSFLLLIPLILGTMIFEILKTPSEKTFPFYIYLIAMVISFITGYIALKILISIVRRQALFKFSYYCIALSIFSILFWILFKN